MFLRTTSGTQVIHRLIVDWEKAHRRAILRSHVGDRRPIGEGQIFCALPIKLDELPDHLGLAKHFGHRQCQVRSGYPFAQRTFELHAHDVGRQKVNRLAKHTGLGFDSADTPANDSQTVNHRCVRIGAHQRIRVVDVIRIREYSPREVFEIHLMNNPDPRRHNLKRVKRLHAPLQELIPLPIAFELQLEVFVHRILRASEVNLHGVIHHQIHRHQWLDNFWILAQPLHRRSHRG